MFYIFCYQWIDWVTQNIIRKAWDYRYEKFYRVVLSKGQGIAEAYDAFYKNKIDAFNIEFPASSFSENKNAMDNITVWLKSIDGASTKDEKLKIIKDVRKALKRRLDALFQYLLTIIGDTSLDSDSSDDDSDDGNGLELEDISGVEISKIIKPSLDSLFDDSDNDNDNVNVNVNDTNNNNNNMDIDNDNNCEKENNPNSSNTTTRIGSEMAQGTKKLLRVKPKKQLISIVQRVSKILDIRTFKRNNEYIEIPHHKSVNLCVMNHLFSDWVDCRLYNHESLSNLVLFMFVGDTGNDEGFKLLRDTLYTIMTRVIKHMKSFSLLSYKTVDDMLFIREILRILNDGIDNVDDQFACRRMTPQYGVKLSQQEQQLDQIWKSKSADEPHAVCDKYDVYSF